MESSRFDRISMLTANKGDKKTDWKIKVRLTRMWKSINSMTGDFKGYNMILLDDDKTHIHAFAGIDFVNGIDDIPEEGKVYVISEFNVDDAKYSYSPVSNSKEIYFLKRTNMKLIKEDDDMIPQHKFELVAFTALEEKVGNIKILTDVMGLVENILPMQSRNTATGPKDIIMFDITDGSEKVKVTVWAELAHTLREELEKRKEEQRIIILTSCGITKYQGQIQASTLSPSKFYINLDYDAVYHLRNRLNDVNEKSVVEDTTSVADCLKKTIPTYNLKQITDLRSSDLETLEVICHVSVCDVDAQSKWWFYSCDACPAELSLIGDTYKCEDCPKIVSYPDKRFKLPMYVTDPSETIQVILFDREVRRLMSTTVNSLIGENKKEGKGEQFPEKLKNITGKVLTITISLNTNNLRHGSTVYFASDVFERVQTIPNQMTADMEQDPAHSVDGGTTNMQSTSKKRPSKNDDGENKKNKSKIV